MPGDGDPNSVFNWNAHRENIARQGLQMGAAAQVPPPHQAPNREHQLRPHDHRAEAELLLHYRREEPESQHHYDPGEPEPHPYYGPEEPEPHPYYGPEEPEPQPHEEPEPQPYYDSQVPEAVWYLAWDDLLKQHSALGLGVYSAFRTRSGYRKVMGKSGSRRRKAANVGAVAGVAAAAVVAGATVAGGILVVTAIL